MREVEKQINGMGSSTMLPLSGPMGHLSPRGEARCKKKCLPRMENNEKREVDKWHGVQRHAAWTQCRLANSMLPKYLFLGRYC